MTKAELIEKLENVPDDAEIWVYDLYGDKISASYVEILFFGVETDYSEVFIS